MHRRVMTQLLQWLIIAITVFFFSFSILLVFSQAPSSQLHCLKFTTLSKIGLDIVFIPEDYDIDEMDKFKETVETYYRALLSVSPFSEFKDCINVWRIDTTVDFGLYRNPTMDRLFSVNKIRVKQFVESILDLDIDETRPNDLIIVLVDDFESGGSGLANIAVAYTGNSGSKIMIHEIGHSFGKLGDEYILKDEDYPAEQPITQPNIDWDGSKWKDVPGTGAYLGAWYRNLVRPTYDRCIMRNVKVSEFCPVCKRALASSLASYRNSKILLYVGVPIILVIFSVTFVKRRQLITLVTRDPARTRKLCPHCGTFLLYENVQFCFRCRKKLASCNGGL